MYPTFKKGSTTPPSSGTVAGAVIGVLGAVAIAVGYYYRNKNHAANADKSNVKSEEEIGFDDADDEL
jgi:broad specificity polyphosphatase/5'/3'-nucleotidase SurE